jgi:CHAD domain-containing protein
VSRSSVTRFTVAGTPDVDELIAGLASRASLERDDAAAGPVVREVLDTFDWRLHASGTVLELASTDQGRALTWRSIETGAVLGRIDVDVEGAPRFAWDLPAGPVADRIADVIDVRALVPLVRLESLVTTLRLLDDQDKTIARLTVDRSTLPDGTALPVVLEVASLRGYEREARRFGDLLAAQVVLAPATDDVAVEALRRAGYVPGSYSSKLRLDLDPSSTALHAWATVLRTLLGTLQANEAGVRADLDSEFLHDFRVAVRRARSVLGEARGVFDGAVPAGMRTELAWLGQQTGPTRDLDVELLMVPEFEAGLPPDRRADLKPFAAFLERRQAQAQQALVAELDSSRYRDLLATWRGLLDVPDAAAGPRADEPAAVVAADRIRRAHRRLVRDGRAIDDASAPEALHDLRKDAKRLRYLLECFGSLFPAPTTTPVVRELKALQDVLGDYQDAQVQADTIGHFAQEVLDEGQAPAATLLAMGLVVDQLGDIEHRARAGFAERFARFDAADVRSCVRDLVAAADQAAEDTADQAVEPEHETEEAPTGGRKGGDR